MLKNKNRKTTLAIYVEVVFDLVIYYFGNN